MSYDFSEIDESCEKRVLSSSRISSNVGRPIPRRERKWKPDYESESDSNLSDIENLQIEPTSQCKNFIQNHLSKKPFIFVAISYKSTYGAVPLMVAIILMIETQYDCNLNTESDYI